MAKYRFKEIGSDAYYDELYNIYSKKRIEIANRGHGYAMNEQLSKNSFKEMYNDLKNKGYKNIIRSIAENEKIIDYRGALDIKRKLKERGINVNISEITMGFKDLDFLPDKGHKWVVFGKSTTMGNADGRSQGQGMTNLQAWYAAMRELNAINESEEYYGY